MRTRRRWLVLVVLTALFAACSGSGSDDADGGGDIAPEAGTWTVLSYSMADTDLEPFMMDDIDEMAQVGTGDDLNIVALVDRAGDYSDQAVAGQDDWVGAKLLQIDPDGSSTILEEPGDINTGDPDVLAGFIERGLSDYPADNYALVINDHGAAWPGVGGDESSDHDLLDLAELDDAIGRGLDGAGVDKLDLLGFDACLMATYEVASRLAPHADRLLASQELEPGHGWDYHALRVAAERPVTVDELGAALIDGFEGQARDEETEAEITLSLVDLTRMGAVDEALASFTSAAVDRGAALAPVVGRTRAQTISYGRNPDPTEDTHMTDLASLVAQIGVEALDVSDEADALVRALNDAVVDRVTGQAMAGSTGLSIYFPPQAEHFDERYEGVTTAGGWNGFLSSYYRSGEAIPQLGRARFADDGEVALGEDGVTITASIDAGARANLAEAYLRYGIVNADGSATYLGQEPAELPEDGAGEAVGVYDLTQLIISDGEDRATAYIELTLDDESGTQTIDVPMAYYAPEDVNGETYQDVLLSLVSDAESGDITSETFYAYDDELGTFGELTADPDGIIVPEVLDVLPDGSEEWRATSDVGLFADIPSLQYDFEDLPAGTQVSIELFVVDFGGNVARVQGVVTVR